MHRGWSRASFLAAAVVLVASGSAAAQTPATGGAAGAPRAEPAAADPTRATDAELRLALFELLSDRPAAALARLTAMGTTPLSGDREGARHALARRVLATEAQARLGLDEQLERSAGELLDDPAARAFAPALRARLAVRAYARGDDGAVLRFAGGAPSPGGDGVAPLMAGLARLRAGAPRDAMTELAAARRAGGVAASIAAYADAVARLRADSAAAPAALDSLAALASRDQGDVGDRAGVTAAQIAYQLGRYEQAARVAAAVRGEAARSDALLVQGWALYKGGVPAQAVAAFDEYARREPHDAASGEAQVMAAQALLLAGATPDAGRRLRAIGPPMVAAAAELERGRAALVNAAAEELVARGAAADPWTGDAGLTLRADGAGLFDPATLAAVLTGRDAPTGAALPLRAADSRGNGAPSSALAARLLRTPGDPRRVAESRQEELGRRLQRLATADFRAATARLAVDREIAAQSGALAAAASAQRALAADGARLDAVTRRLAAARATLARIGTGARPGDRRAPAARGGAAQDDVAGLRMLRDSVQRTLTRLESSVAAMRARRAETAAGAERLATLARREGALRQARAAVDAAEAERAAAARGVVELVARELDARVPVAVATLRRDAEAAEFAAAGAAFLASSRGDVPRPAQVLRTRRAPAAGARP